MDIQPVKTTKESLVEQVKNHLLDLIRRGVYKRGDKLDTEVDLATKLGVARGTLREALNNLELAGVVIRKHGIGTFIASEYNIRLQSELEKHESVLDLAARQGIQIQYTDLKMIEDSADSMVAKILHIDEGTSITRIERVILADGNRVAFMKDITPSQVLSSADIDHTFQGSVLDLIRRKQGLQVSKAIAKIEAINADLSLAQKLEIEPGLAILVLEETLFDEDEKPMELSYNFFVPNFFQFMVSRYYNNNHNNVSQSDRHA